MSTWLCQSVPTLTPPGARMMGAKSATELSAQALARLEQLADQTEFPLFCFDAETGVVVWQSDQEAVPFCPRSRRLKLRDVTETEIVVLNDGWAYFLFPLSSESNSRPLVIGGYCLTTSGARPQDLILEATAAHWSAAQIETFLSRLSVCPERMLCRLLQLALQQFQQAFRVAQLEQENAALLQTSTVHESETQLLQELIQKLQLSRSAEELAVFLIRRLHTLIGAAGHAICLESAADHVEFLIEGRLPVDEASLARLLSRFEGHDWSQPLVKNHLQQTLLGADFPGLQSLVVVPLCAGQTRRGWMLSVNAQGKREFTAADANLLSSMAAILGTHLHNQDLYSQHDELLVSFVRLLVTTLDAKDPYTRGHSERVALIARKLGEQLQLPESDLEDIYLSGLLHDLGKVGVDERILRKPDQLTQEEFQHIQQHPLIGYQILSHLKSLHHILPGVRSHHEAVNGRGYPDRLRGDEIPLMARILAVADAYDAMCSDRPYRKGMPVEKLEDIFRKGAGEQWDSRVIDAYFSVRDDVSKLCEEYSPTTGNLLSERAAACAAGITVRTFLRH